MGIINVPTDLIPIANLNVALKESEKIRRIIYKIRKSPILFFFTRSDNAPMYMILLPILGSKNKLAIITNKIVRRDLLFNKYCFI
jgi:hypothetical protein